MPPPPRPASKATNGLGWTASGEVWRFLGSGVARAARRRRHLAKLAAVPDLGRSARQMGGVLAAKAVETQGKGGGNARQRRCVYHMVDRERELRPVPEVPEHRDVALVPDDREGKGGVLAVEAVEAYTAKGGVLAAEAVETHTAKCGVLAVEAVETHTDKCGVLAAEVVEIHTAKSCVVAVETMEIHTAKCGVLAVEAVETHTAKGGVLAVEAVEIHTAKCGVLLGLAPAARIKLFVRQRPPRPERCRDQRLGQHHLGSPEHAACDLNPSGSVHTYLNKTRSGQVDSQGCL